MKSIAFGMTGRNFLKKEKTISGEMFEKAEIIFCDTIEDLIRLLPFDKMILSNVSFAELEGILN